MRSRGDNTNPHYTPRTVAFLSAATPSLRRGGKSERHSACPEDNLGGDHGTEEPQVQAHLFEDDGRIPNNPDLPLLLYLVLRLVYTSSTPTHANDGEQARSVPQRNPLICRYFWTPANSHDVMDLTLHGGGQGFESPRLHSKNVAFCR
jgi:hypothetical protein